MSPLHYLQISLYSMLKKGRSQESRLADLKRNQEESCSVWKSCIVLRLSGENIVVKLCGKGLLIGKVEMKLVFLLLPQKPVKPQIKKHNQDTDLERTPYSVKKIGQLPETSHKIIGFFFCSPGTSLCLTVTFPLRQAKKRFKPVLYMMVRVERHYLQT